MATQLEPKSLSVFLHFCIQPSADRKFKNSSDTSQEDVIVSAGQKTEWLPEETNDPMGACLVDNSRFGLVYLLIQSGGQRKYSLLAATTFADHSWPAGRTQLARRQTSDSTAVAEVGPSDKH